jgi:hypothetical protein
LPEMFAKTMANINQRKTGLNKGSFFSRSSIARFLLG